MRAERCLIRVVALEDNQPLHRSYTEIQPVTPDDLLHAAPAIAKGAAAIGVAIPFTSIVKRMLGPAADELAEMWRDQVRLYRYERQLKCVQKAERMAQEAGFTPQAVPPKILFPLLEGASFEENEDLHTMWAALLANAASPKDAGNVRPTFVAILKQMAPDEAALFNWIYDEAEKSIPAKDIIDPLPQSILVPAYASLGFGTVNPNPPAGHPSATVDAWQFGSCFDCLEAAQLIRTRDDVVKVGYSGPYFSLTYLGAQFMRACRQPEPKA